MVLIRRAAVKDAEIETDLWTRVGERKEGEMNGQSSMEAYTLPYIKQITNGNLTGNENWGSVKTQKYRKWWEVGRRVKEGGDICTPMANSC